MWDWLYRLFVKSDSSSKNFDEKLEDFRAKRAVRIIEKHYLNYKKRQKIKAIRAKRRKTYRVLDRTNKNFNNYLKKTHYFNNKYN